MSILSNQEEDDMGGSKRSDRGSAEFFRKPGGKEGHEPFSRNPRVVLIHEE